MIKKYFLHGLIAISIVFFFFSFSYSQVGKEIPGKKPPNGEIVADSADYVIGPEDVLYIHVWREETITRTVTVRMDGKISLPLIDDIQAAGKTPLQLKEESTQKLKEFIDNPIISVVVMEANSFKVYVSGQVKTPGVFRLRSETSIAQIISMTGGLTEWANPKKIIVIRKEDGKEKRIIVNYKKVIQGEDLSANIILKAGDTIIIP
ncbi:MAG: polysaccharide export protein [Deltaproteobacteria bacterium]|nr:polysaccharide export protein [Deltaproteobacteria bacterium]